MSESDQGISFHTALALPTLPGDLAPYKFDRARIFELASEKDQYMTTDDRVQDGSLKAYVTPDNRPRFARGYYGLAIYRPKKEVNFGSLLRTAQIFDAAFIALIGSRYHRQASDTFGAVHHVPIFEYDSFDSFYVNLPRGCPIVAVEQHERAKDLRTFQHPLSAVYLLGAEDDGLPAAITDRCHDIVMLKGEKSMNLAVAGSIVIYHRLHLGPAIS